MVPRSFNRIEVSGVVVIPICGPSGETGGMPPKRSEDRRPQLRRRIAGLQKLTSRCAHFYENRPTMCPDVGAADGGGLEGEMESPPPRDWNQ
jgi:hypothetical protein